jgi:xeroderma pigmentosum group C-complementing protein
VRADELDKPAKVVKKRSLPAGGGGTGRSSKFRGGWGPWQRPGSTNSSMSVADADSAQASAPAAALAAAPAAAAAAAAAGAAAAAAEAAGGEEEGAAADSNSQRLYGLWQTDEFVRRAQDGKVPRNERGNVEVPPFAKSLPLGGCGHAYAGLCGAHGRGSCHRHAVLRR